jgi:hypothetical protein
MEASWSSCAMPTAAAGLAGPATASMTRQRGAALQVQGQEGVANAPALFKEKGLSFEKLGIGGLDTQFEQIFRRAFSSRAVSAATIERMGIRCTGHEIKMHGCDLSTSRGGVIAELQDSPAVRDAVSELVGSAGMSRGCCCTGRRAPARH